MKHKSGRTAGSHITRVIALVISGIMVIGSIVAGLFALMWS